MTSQQVAGADGTADGADSTAVPDGLGPGDTLSASESLDSEDVRNNDGDTVVDPPEGWSAADKFGMTGREEREGQSLDDKVAAEQPDTAEATVDADSDTARADLELQGVDVNPADPGTHRGQIAGTPEDGDSLFPVVD